MNLKLEAIIVPVSDVDRAKKFYQEALGFRVDVDHRAAVYEEALGFRYRGEASYRIVQMTPPGSECSIQIGKGLTRARPGAYQGMYLISSDIEATRAELIERGVEVSEPFHFGPEGQTPGLDPRRADYNSFVSFSDPDGNGWLIQEIKQRAPGR
jgi:catechol 2,3-dioxygenase-like lactoylglutathione lyase family enzyme